MVWQTACPLTIRLFRIKTQETHAMHRITNTGRVNLGHLFWLRSLAIIGQLVTIAVVQIFYGAHLPIPAMLLVIGLEMIFNATDVAARRARAARDESRTVRAIVGRSGRAVGVAVSFRRRDQSVRHALHSVARDRRRRACRGR